jgi:VNT family MFS transporter (synaptic vesicle glycoprotein 2)
MILVSVIMFCLCFGYYGLWMWLPELFKRMKLYGGSPCSSNINMNTTVITNVTNSCHIDNSVYLSTFYSSLSNLPGNIFTILFIDKMGRNLITSISFFLSGLSVFGIPFIQNESEGVILTT